MHDFTYDHLSRYDNIDRAALMRSKLYSIIEHHIKPSHHLIRAHFLLHLPIRERIPIKIENLCSITTTSPKHRLFTQPMKARTKYDPMTSFLIKNPKLNESDEPRQVSSKKSPTSSLPTLKVSRLMHDAQIFTPSVQLKKAPPTASVTCAIEHDYYVQLYRSNMTNKCPTEIKLAQVNQARFEYGSIEWHNIKRSCFNANCCAKYHWCPTCLLAPRCDCFMPHMTSTIGQDMKVIWSPDQFYYSSSLGRLTCDNRYGTFVQSVRSVAGNLDVVSSPFCLECTKSLRNYSLKIVRVSGRTYLEQASNLWKIISPIMCDQCINIIDGFPCMHLGTKCPSTYMKLICTRLKNYQPRQTIEKSKMPPVRRVNGQIVATIETTPGLSIREAIRSSKKPDINFSRTPGGRIADASGDRRSYLTTDICTSNPPWMSADIRNVRSEAWMNFWQGPDDSTPPQT